MEEIYDRVVRPNRYGYVTVGLQEHYSMYLHSPNRKYEPLDKKLYKHVVETIFTKIWHNMFKNRWIFNAPLKFGQFYIAETFVSEGFYKDWGETRKKGRLIKRYNLHSDGRKFYIKWNKFLTKIRHKTYFKFLPYRGSGDDLTGRRGLARWIKTCSEDPYLSDFRGHLI